MKFIDVSKTLLLICGGRHFDDYYFLSTVIGNFIDSHNLTNIEIVSGHCAGTDMLAERFAVDHNYELSVFPADWKKYGKAAGPIRNKQMIDYLINSNCNKYVIGFASKNSKGTLNTLHLADINNIPNIKIEYEYEEFYSNLQPSLSEILEGVTFDSDSDEFNYDWETDSRSDIIKLASIKSIHQYTLASNGKKFVRYYGYKVSQDKDNKIAKSKFLKYIKSPPGLDDANVELIIDHCVDNLLNSNNTFDLIIKAGSSSKLVSTIANNIKEKLQCDDIDTIKSFPSDVKINWDLFEYENRNKPEEYVEKFRQYLTTLYKNTIQKDYASIGKVPPQYRKYITNLFKFKDKFVDLSKYKNILIIDDTFTLGTSFKNIISLIAESSNFDGTISLLSLFDNR